MPPANQARTRTRTRDSDRAWTYSAENMFTAMLDTQYTCPAVTIGGSTVNVPLERKFGNIVQVQQYIALAYEVCNIPGLVPTVRERQGTTKATYARDLHEIAIPIKDRWALHELIVLHETAHSATPEHGHDKHFRREYTRIVGLMMGPEAQFILNMLMLEIGLEP